MIIIVVPPTFVTIGPPLDVVLDAVTLDEDVGEEVIVLLPVALDVEAVLDSILLDVEVRVAEEVGMVLLDFLVLDSILLDVEVRLTEEVGMVLDFLVLDSTLLDVEVRLTEEVGWRELVLIVDKTLLLVALAVFLDEERVDDCFFVLSFSFVEDLTDVDTGLLLVTTVVVRLALVAL